MILVADTNVIISALIRDSLTRSVLLHPFLDLFIPEFLVDELELHRQEIIRKSGLTEAAYEKLLNAFMTRLNVVEKKEFADSYVEALGVMRGIDEDDAEFLALALVIDADGIWTNDRHFLKQTRIRVWTTAELANLLGL